MFKPFSTVGLAFAIVFISSCGAPSASAPTTAPAPTQAAAAATSSPIVVKDSRGTVALDAVPSRVVACSEEALDFLITLGVQPIGMCSDRVAGATSGSVFDRPYFFPKDALGTPVFVGGAESPSLEQIAQLKPDLIISGVWAEEANKRMAQIAPLFIVDTATPDYWRGPLLELGKVFGREAQAQQFIDEYDASAKRLAAELAPVTACAPNVLFIYSYAATDGTMLLGPRWTGSKPFELFGFKVLAPEGYDLSSGALPVSPEIVSEVQADIVFVLRIKTPDGEIPHYPIDDLVASLKDTRVIYQGVDSTRGSTAPYTDRFALEEIGGLLKEDGAATATATP
ncbi:ABC transporter substrate-binding protein [Chloroflexia bacterium SDU3-3]|nr:ABC transporter substrate-binding protein [Chloroflexia bacterium SDU3-3]